MAIEIDFEKMMGLAPAIVQDATTGEVLMLGFMNREAYDKTLRTGYVTFYSRTRNELWTKGETSGNRLRVITAAPTATSTRCCAGLRSKVKAWSATQERELASTPIFR